MDSKKILNNSLFCLEKRRMRVCVILPDYERLLQRMEIHCSLLALREGHEMLCLTFSKGDRDSV